MHSGQVHFEMLTRRKYLAANFARERLDVRLNVVHVCQMRRQGALVDKLPAAERALVCRLTRLLSRDGAAAAAVVSVRRVAVSEDRRLVAERHVTYLTLYSS